MRAVIQRVSQASVAIDGHAVASIGRGLLVLLGVASEDGDDDIAWLAGKIARLRVFADASGQTDLGLSDVQGELLVVSQFTLYASTRKGNRPSFTRAAPPDFARTLYEKFLVRLAAETGGPVNCGVFGADMKVQLVNDGPVTILIDTKTRE